MKVYFNSNLWGSKTGRAGVPLRVNWQFDYDGTKRIIPRIYRFTEGIVLDIITLLDASKLRRFSDDLNAYDKPLSKTQRMYAHQAHPYRDLPVSEISIDGHMINSGHSYSSSIYMPWESNDNKMFRRIRRAYSRCLKGCDCFACQRVFVPYDAAYLNSRRMKVLLPFRSIKHLSIAARPLHMMFPLNMRFELSKAMPQAEVSFVHPPTGVTHTLCFSQPKPVEFPAGVGATQTLFATTAQYEIQPALPEGEYLQFSNSVQVPQPASLKLDCASAASVGIIGGADGPTAVFVASKHNNAASGVGAHGLPINYCMSVPALDKQASQAFIIEGIQTVRQKSTQLSFAR